MGEGVRKSESPKVRKSESPEVRKTGSPKDEIALGVLECRRQTCEVSQTSQVSGAFGCWPYTEMF